MMAAVQICSLNSNNIGLPRDLTSIRHLSILQSDIRVNICTTRSLTVAYAQIDWHDFVVVETVDYIPGEFGNFLPPTTPDEVGARVLMQERILENEGADLAEAAVSDEERVRKRTVTLRKW